MEQSSILSAKFDCPVARQNCSLFATAHDCKTGLLHFNYQCHNVSVMFDNHTILLLDYLVIVHIQIIGNLNNSDLHIGNLDNREFKAKQPRTTTATSAKRIITKDKKRT